MKEKLQEALDALRTRLASLAARGRVHTFWIRCAVITVLGLVAAFSAGSAALRRRDEIVTRIAELQQVEAGYNRWRSELQLPTAEETADWGSSDTQLLSVGGETSRPINLAGQIAGRASEVGVSNLQIRTMVADSVAPIDPVVLGGWTVQAAGEGLIVEFDAEIAGVMGFLASLPAQAAVSELTMTAAGDVLHARVVIATRQILRNG